MLLVFVFVFFTCSDLNPPFIRKAHSRRQSRAREIARERERAQHGAAVNQTDVSSSDSSRCEDKIYRTHHGFTTGPIKPAH